MFHISSQHPFIYLHFVWNLTSSILVPQWPKLPAPHVDWIAATRQRKGHYSVVTPCVLLGVWDPEQTSVMWVHRKCLCVLLVVRYISFQILVIRYGLLINPFKPYSALLVTSYFALCRKDSLCVVHVRFCMSRKGGTGGVGWGHLKGDIHMVAARLGCQWHG